LKKCVPLPCSDRLDNEFSKRRAITVFLDQYLIEMRIPAKRANDIMRITGETDTAQMTQIVVFALHMMKCRFRIKMRDAAEKFSDNPKVTMTVFIEVDMIGSRKPVYAKIGRIQVSVKLGDDILPEVCVKRVMSREMAEIFHDL
jgi:hypothetical protein